MNIYLIILFFECTLDFK